MLGGHDIEIPTPLNTAESLYSAVNAILLKWPKAIVQDGASQDTFEPGSIPFHRLDELLVYKERKWLESWETLGADPTNANTMIYLIGGNNDLTMVVGDPHSLEMSSIVDAVKSALKPTASFSTANTAK